MKRDIGRDALFLPRAHSLEVKLAELNVACSYYFKRIIAES
jgi:hypothetical protein